jgi:hypothetical protein
VETFLQCHQKRWEKLKKAKLKLEDEHHADVLGIWGAFAELLRIWRALRDGNTITITKCKTINQPAQPAKKPIAPEIRVCKLKRARLN